MRFISILQHPLDLFIYSSVYCEAVSFLEAMDTIPMNLDKNVDYSKKWKNLFMTFWRTPSGNFGDIKEVSYHYKYLQKAYLATVERTLMYTISPVFSNSRISFNMCLQPT